MDKLPTSKRVILQDVAQKLSWAEDFCGAFPPEDIEGAKQEVHALHDLLRKIIRSWKPTAPPPEMEDLSK